MYRVIYLPTAEYIKHIFIDENIDRAVFDCKDKKALTGLLNSKNSGIYPFAARNNEKHEYKFENEDANFVLINSSMYAGEQPKHLFEVVEIPDV
jgi:hypothetical protein